MTRAVDLTGQVFGRLTVVGAAPHRPDPRRRACWRCSCSCGATKEVRADHLTSGASQSCGCQIGALAKLRATHGKTRTPEYRVWGAMIERCHSPSSKAFRFYGGRGIMVCDRWRDFAAFIADMGPRPGNDLQLDRIDNNGNYEPGNVRWATRKENCRNRRDNLLVTIDGATKSVAEWSEVAVVKPETFYRRVKRGWDPEAALRMPARVQAA